jgi:hypothetical protein
VFEIQAGILEEELELEVGDWREKGEESQGRKKDQGGEVCRCE